jgi:RHS repeat-associated protein
VGRLTSVKTPETNNTATSYLYDNFNNLTQRTDARGVITTYGYDDLNRFHTVDYNVGTTGVAATPSLVYTYGTNSAQNNNGRLIMLTDGVGSENYSYDANLPLTTQVQKVVSGTTYNTGYQYNLAGELKQITYPSGRVVQESYDAIGRLCAIAQTSSGCSSNTNPYATGYGYNTAFELTGFNYANGVAATFGYSADRLQMTSLSYVKGTTTLYSLNYSYGAAGSNNGQIQSITDNVDNGRSVAFSYDNLARLTNAVTTGSTGYPKWGLQWLYDVYGNRTQQNISSGCTGLTCPTNQVAVSTATNRITTSGYAYDANGNMTNDGVNTLTYDGENHLLTSSGTLGSGTYTYDGNGLRVKKVAGSTTTVYAFSGSKVIAEYVNGAAPGSPTREYVYAGGTMLAKIESGATQYYHRDHLSVRVMTDASGTKIGEQGFFPWGESWYLNNTVTKWAFTTYERDAESGNDYAMARQYVSRLGRFSSPDPLSGSTGNPQSLNRYAYVRNDPINKIDPSGLACYWDDGTHDDPPQDGGADQQQCEDQGGTWIDDVEEKITVEGGPITPISLSENPIQGGSIGAGPGGQGIDSIVFNAVSLALEALKKDLCKKLFGANADPIALLQSLYNGTGPGAIFTGPMGGASKGNQTVADTQGILGLPITSADGTLISAGFVGAVISINSDPAAQFTAGWGNTRFSGNTNAVMNAVIIIHELGHAAELIPGAGGSSIVSDGPDIPNGVQISEQNTQKVLDNCFPK